MKIPSIFCTSMVCLMALLLGLAAPAFSQQLEDVTTSIERNRILITFDVKGQLRQEKTTYPEFPLAIIQRLVQENTLAELDIQSGSGLAPDLFYPFTLRFVFTSMDIFTEWYTSESTRQLFQNIREEATFDIALSVQRDPLSFQQKH